MTFEKPAESEAAREAAGELAPLASPDIVDPVIEAYKTGIDRTLIRENIPAPSSMNASELTGHEHKYGATWEPVASCWLGRSRASFPEIEEALRSEFACVHSCLSGDRNRIASPTWSGAIRSCAATPAMVRAAFKIRS